MTDLTVSLTAQLDVEQALMARIRSLPKARRPEYARQLMLKGFIAECGESGSPRGGETVSHTGNKLHHAEDAAEPGSQAPEAEEPASFASLKNLIG